MSTEKQPIPEEFQKIIKDFIGDVLTTFPEYEPIVMKWWAKDFSLLSETEQSVKMNYIFSHCLQVFPEARKWPIKGMSTSPESLTKMVWAGCRSSTMR